MGETSMRKPSNPFLEVSPLMIFQLIGLFIMGGSVYTGHRTAQRLKAVAAWPTAPAYIIESRIEWDVRTSRSAGSRPSHSYEYQLPVLAGYTVDGQYFTSSTPAITTIRDIKLYPRDPWRNPPDDDMVAMFKRVPQGAVVPIHYNPARKAEAYFFSELPFWKLYTLNVVFFGLGLLSFCFWLVPVLFTWHYRRRAASA